ncbi:hypothetical protein [Dyadobacter aurulentus]|uniref:hypothetical protein n=1 Tax=Dyadobacter sp. UC 10 TaxID=2605428 RepID=UPI0011F31A97|nr:hypothetical protein [Dyadobacter sp. UC 10]KAA0991276.1 hypothetical protein FXO21_14450 [Dyadobacter sp. UC 10]
MKSFLNYLTFSLLLVVCYCVKKYTVLAQPRTKTEVSGRLRHFVGRFSTEDKPAAISPLQMSLHFSDNFIKGSYRHSNSQKEVELVGALNGENELIIIETSNGKTTGAFKGTFENGDNSLLRLTGIWSSVQSDHLRPFSLQEVR